MIPVLLLHLDAPMMSFGGVAVDEVRRTEELPTLSLLTGLLGNALGYDHRDAEALQELQGRIRYAVRGPAVLQQVMDYQTVDLGQDFMLADQVGWTTRGRVEVRKGGTAKTGTHIRQRYYIVDAAYTVALTLDGEGALTVERLGVALQWPARPLFIGRKCCLPSRPLLQGIVQAPALVDAFQHVAPVRRECSVRAGRPLLVRIWEQAEGPGRHDAVSLTDERDWANQVHVGRRWMSVRIEEVHR